MPKSFAKGGGSGSSGITVGTTTSTGTSETLLKTNATGKAADASGLTNTSTGSLTLAQGTLAGASTPAVSQTATWNNGATTFTNILSNVTDTASASGSLLMDLQVGGSSKFKVGKDGGIVATANANIGANAIFLGAVYNFADNYHAQWSGNVLQARDSSEGIRGMLGGGTAVASAAAMPVPTGRVFHVTGTTNITSITSTGFATGAVITLIFDGILTFTDGGNLKLAGNFVTTADDTITLVYDGTNWYEMCRSVN